MMNLVTKLILLSGRKSFICFRRTYKRDCEDSVRLTDLEPHWISFPTAVDGMRFYFGVSFLCPHCSPSLPEHGAQRRRRMAVSFWPPVDPDGWESKIVLPPHEKYHRRVSGDTFQTLTLEPSINFEGHWHGRITNGEITH